MPKCWCVIICHPGGYFNVSRWICIVTLLPFCPIYLSGVLLLRLFSSRSSRHDFDILINLFVTARCGSRKLPIRPLLKSFLPQRPIHAGAGQIAERKYFTFGRFAWWYFSIQYLPRMSVCIAIIIVACKAGQALCVLLLKVSGGFSPATMPSPTLHLHQKVKTRRVAARCHHWLSVPTR